MSLNDFRNAPALLDATIESTSSGVVICDMEVNFLTVNPVGQQLLGQLVDLPPDKWTSEVGIFADEEQTECVPETSLPLFRATRGEHIADLELLIRNGKSEPPIWVRSNASPIKDPDGTIIGAVAIFEDFSELRKNREELKRLQKKTQFELVHSNRLLDQVLNSIEEVIWRGEMDSESTFNFVYFSPGVARMTGMTPEELTSGSEAWLRLIHEEDRGLLRETISELFSGKKDFAEEEYRICRPDDSIRWIRNRVKVSVSDEPDKRVFQGVMIDITEERDAKLALNRAERLASIGTLAAGIAHEINNPLGAMMLTTERAVSMIKRDEFTKSQLLEPCQLIIDQIERCKRIVTGVLKFASQDDLVRKPACPLTVANDAKKLILFKANRRQISVDVICENPVEAIEINEVAICQAILNLLANAVAVSPVNTKVEVLVNALPDRVELSVHDSGTGFDDETKQLAFDPFFTTRRESGGTGLGLSMCHAIVTKHGGEITIGESTRLVGAKVSFWLPRQPA